MQASGTTTTPAPRPPRPPRRLRPPSPPLQLVALAGLELPPGPVAGFLRSVPCIAGRMVQIEALRLVDELSPDLGVSAAERIAAQRHGVSPRSVRRWRRGS